MEETLPEPREDVSEFAPKTVKIQIPKDKIGMVIGSGGSTIKEIVSEFDVTIDISSNDFRTGYLQFFEKIKESKESELIQEYFQAFLQYELHNNFQYLVNYVYHFA